MSLTIEELSELEDKIIEELPYKITAVLSKLNRSDRLEEFLEMIDMTELLEKKQDFYFDFILMDVQMPKLNGYDATRKIRKSARDDRNIPIIAFTADAYDDDVKKAILSGMDGHVSKPVSKESLRETITTTILKCSYKK